LPITNIALSVVPSLGWIVSGTDSITIVIEPFASAVAEAGFAGSVG
jgi:hypothetical protein